MRIGLYFIFGLILAGLTGAYVHSLHLGNHIHKILGVDVNLPIAAWVIIPMLLLFFFSLIHMMYYATIGYFGKKKWIKDAGTLQDALYWSLLKEPKEHKYLTKDIRDSAKLLAKSTVEVTGSVEGVSEKFTNIIALIKDIERGEYVDLKEKGLAKKLSKENPIYIKNTLNRLDVDPKFVEDVLQSTAVYSKETVARGLRLFAENETFYKAKKYVKIFDVDNFFVLLERAAESKDDMGMNEDMIESFIAELPFGCKEYMHLARICVKKFSPDTNLSMFKAFQKHDEKASQSYLYLLFEYEMLDAVEEFLSEHGQKEFVRFRALHTLKKMNNKYNVEGMVSSYAVCDEN
ncbi:MAG: hypothetical protein U9R26_04465 [Campylobacterota bacterium]|nr:hypothetical protein [Campylobacterota bacterium]